MWWRHNRSSAQGFSTQGILQQADPRCWRDHYFGLPRARWDSLEGCAFWITGAGTGYGRVIALALAASGAAVFLTGRRSEKLQETLEEGASLGININRCIPIVADITSESGLDRATNLISRHVTQLHGLVNNAAMPQPSAGIQPLTDLSLASWNELFNVNVTAQWLVSKAAMPLLFNSDSIRIVFMSSEAGWASTPGFGPYNISKSAVNTLGSSLAAEWAGHFLNKDIQINVLVPGEARTEMNQGSTVSPYSVVSMTLALLSHPSGGPNGCFFHRDGRHLEFAHSPAYMNDLLIP